MPQEIPAVQLTVEEKICLHLLENNHLRSQYIMPVSVSQNGIAESVGVQRGHASVALISLKNKDLIEEKISRVKGSTRRKKVYFLTESGREEGAKIRDHVEESSVPVVEDGVKIQHTIREIRNSLGTPLPLVTIVNNVRRFMVHKGAVLLESISSASADTEDISEGKDPADHPRSTGFEDGSMDQWKRPGTGEREPGKDESSLGDELPGSSDMEGRQPNGEDEIPMVPPPYHHPDFALPPTSDPYHIHPSHPYPPYPPHYMRETKPRRFSGRQYSIFTGLAASVITIILLWVTFEQDNTGAHILAYLLLMLAISAFNAHSFKRYPPTWEVRITLQDMMLLIFSLMLLTVTMQASIDDRFEDAELAQAMLVVIPLLVLINARQMVPDTMKLRISGIAGTLIILYGLSQTLSTYFAGEMHYPFLWVLGGFLISVNGYFSMVQDPAAQDVEEEEAKEKELDTELEKKDESEAGDEEEGRKDAEIECDEKGTGEDTGEAKDKEMSESEAEEKKLDSMEEREDGISLEREQEKTLPEREGAKLSSEAAFAELITSSCIGAGIFIIISITALMGEISVEGRTVFLVFIWFIFALMLIFIGHRGESGTSNLSLLMSSLMVLTGLLFFFAAGIFITLDKFIEAAMEVIVGLIILRFSLHYLSFRKENLIFTAILVLVGMLSVYEVYANI